MGCVHGEGDPLTDQTEWVLDRIVELHPDAKAGFEPQMAIQTIQEAIDLLEGRSPTRYGASLFGLVPSCIDSNKVEQMLTLLRDALEAWRSTVIEDGEEPKDRLT